MGGRRTFNIATFNVRGLSEDTKQQSLVSDVIKYNVDVCCLQETKIKDSKDVNLRKHRFISLQSDSEHYGNGFLVAPKWADSVYKHWKVSDRIAVLQLETPSTNAYYSYESDIIGDAKLRISKHFYYTSKTKGNTGTKLIIKKTTPKHLITIINVYAPHTDRVKHDRTELDELYDHLSNLVNEFKGSSLLLIAGDFNAIVGKCAQDTACLGNYSRGIRNASGQNLVDFCNINNLFVSNTAFQHPARHITTWESQRINKKTNKVVHIFNQIDYVLCLDKHKCTLQNSRTYAGTLTFSDHRLVVTRMEIEWYSLYKPPKRTAHGRPINSSLLVNDPGTRSSYQARLSAKLSEVNDNTWSSISEAIINTAEEVIGRTPVHAYKAKHNDEIDNLSKQQKDIRMQINNAEDADQIRQLKCKRNELMHDIRRTVKRNTEAELDKRVQEINDIRDDAKMFKAVNALKRKKYENPFIHDEKGRNVTNPQQMYTIINNHFKNHFFDENVSHIEPFVGQPRKLNKEFDTNEITTTLKAMSNNRSADYEEMTVELVKYGPKELPSLIADTINTTFEKHQPLATGVGVLVSLPKPKKAKGPVAHLRPIILLPIIRKILSKATLTRIMPKVEQYLSHSQSAYRPNRSTSDIIWAYRWLIAKAQTVGIEILITGIDMSSAFDTIIRSELLQILDTFLEEDETRIIRLLLSNTTLQLKVNGDVHIEPFTSNVGSPQGDSISGILFNIYLESKLRTVRERIDAQSIMLEHSYCKTLTSSLPDEAEYADDVDFITMNEHRKKRTDIVVGPTLLEGNLKVNDSKTEHTAIKRGDRNAELWRSSKKLGSLLGDIEDIAHRKQLAIVQANDLNKLWIRNIYISEKLRLKLYDSLVKPILIYNAGTWGISKTDEKNLNSFHRRQLRRVLNMKYPITISNVNLYKRTGTRPLSLEILEARWRMFGHNLRLHPETPANKAMNFYFEEVVQPKFRGRPRTTIVTTLNSDIRNAMMNPNSVASIHLSILKTQRDLDNIRRVAQNRELWREITKDIYSVAQANL